MRKQEESEWTNAIWVLGEQRQNGAIHSITLELLSKGKELAKQLEVPLCTIFVGTRENANELLRYGVDAVFFLEKEKEEFYCCETYGKLYASIIKNKRPMALFIGSTSFGREYAPKLAAMLHTDLIADGIEITAEKQGQQIKFYIQRPDFDGKQITVFQYKEGFLPVVTIRAGILEQASYEEKESKKLIEIPKQQIEEWNREQKVVLLKREHTKTNQSLTTAKRIVSGGRGMGTKEDFQKLEKLAGKMGAQVASTRPCVDFGWADWKQQVGQTGNIVKPKLYMAFGVSGAIQHMTGCSQAQSLIAINQNENAPIFQQSDVGVVGDAKKIVDILIKEL